jgi:acyl-CoA thioesterase I
MNPVTLHLASGASAFSGAALLVLGAGASAWCRGRWARSLRSLVGWLGLVLMIASATPWPVWLYLLLGSVSLAWLLAEEAPRVRRITGAVPPRAVLVGLATLMAGMELPHTLPPEIPPLPGRHLYVIGDSISAGIGAGYPPWPDLFAARHILPVTNLAMAGATVADAMPRVAQVKAPYATVLVELGGNDLLSGVPVGQFARDLEALLASLRQPGRTILMMELPLFPLQSGFGRAQRALARRFDVHLIPKRYLAHVLGTRGATVDGLHLSESGTRMMADTVSSILGPALGKPARIQS